MDNSEIKKRLDSINWNFDFTIDYGEDVLHPFNCRKYYSYPATFIPEIPYALIEILSQKGDVVLDPFGGIGTTFMQALSLERVPYSVDINPIASTVCETLYMLFNPAVNKEQIKKQLLQLCKGFDEANDYTIDLSEQRKELAGWFEKGTFNEMSFFFQKYDYLRDRTVQAVMKLILSSILVTLSSQNKGWAYIADNVKPKADELRKKSVFDQYTVSVKTLLNDVIGHEARLPDTYKDFYSVISQKTRVFAVPLCKVSMDEETVDLVVTSPPYPRMIDYVKSQRLSFNFFNMDFSDYVDCEIGARCKRGRRKFLDTYEDDIKLVNARVVKLLKKNGYMCVVLPDYEATDTRKEVIDTIVEDYTNLGLTKVFEVSRYIPSHKRTLSIQWATLVNERIYIFQKG
jgi:hypothetical protein